MKINNVSLENKKLNFKGLNAQKAVNNVIKKEAPKIQQALLPLATVPTLAAIIVNSKQNKQNDELQAQETLNGKTNPNNINNKKEISPKTKEADKKLPFVEKPVIAEQKTAVDIKFFLQGVERVKKRCAEVGIPFKDCYVDSAGNITNAGLNAIQRAKEAAAKKAKEAAFGRKLFEDAGITDPMIPYDEQEVEPISFFGELRNRFNEAIENSKLGEFLEKATEKLSPENITSFFQILGFTKGIFMLTKSLKNDDKELKVKGVVCILDNAVFPIKSAIIGMAGDMFSALGTEVGALGGVTGATAGNLAGRITGVATASAAWEKGRDKIVKKIYDAISGGGDDTQGGGLIGLIRKTRKSNQTKKMLKKDDMSDLKYIDESKSKLRADNIDFGDMKSYETTIGELKEIVFKELFPESLFTLEELNLIRKKINMSEGKFQSKVVKALKEEKKREKLEERQALKEAKKELQKESIFTKISNKINDALSDTTSIWDKLRHKEKQRY